MRILVSGASGNLGSALLRRLDRTAHEVTGVVRRVPPSWWHPEVAWVGLDVASADGVERLRPHLRCADAYVHLAWPLQPMRNPDYLLRAGPTTMHRCMRAALQEGVGQVVHLSSVAAYTGGRALVAEDAELAGIPSSTYSRHKVLGERLLAQLTSEHGDAGVVSVVRPCLVGQWTAGSAMLRSGVSPLVTSGLLRRLPWWAADPDLALQLVHADDVAEAVVRVLERRAGGAFNVAGAGLVAGADLARALSARPLPVPGGVVRALEALAWGAHLQPLDPDWVDMALHCPPMDTARARRELGWSPVHTAGEVLAELAAGMLAAASAGSAPLRRRTVADAVRTTLRRGPVTRRPRT